MFAEWRMHFFYSMLDIEYCRSLLKAKLWDFSDADYVTIKVMVARL